MPRIAPFPETEASAELKAAWAQHIADYPGSRITNMKATLSHSPVAFAVYMQWYPLNITSLISLTYRVLPAMLAQGEGGIINVGSTGSFQPTPYIALYGATKAFVLSFSETLYGEYNSGALR